MLDIVFDDRRLAFPYTQLLRMELEVEETMTELSIIRLCFEKHKITFKGVRLNSVHEALCRRLVVRAWTAPLGAGLREPTVPLIHSIGHSFGL